MDPMKCISSFKVSPDDKLVVISEQHLADASFVFSYLLKQSLQMIDNRIVIVLTHNTIGHFQCCGKRIGYDLMPLIDRNIVKLVDLTDSLDFNVGKVLDDVLDKVEELNKCLSPQGRVYVFVDDMSHFLDLGLSVESCVNFTNALIGANYDDDRVRYVIGSHVGDDIDNNLICKDLEYGADVVVDVSMLKTGRSKDVTGLVNVRRNDMDHVLHHYKAKEMGVQIFKPGELLKR